MKLSLNVLFFGWWLARQCWASRGQIPSKPFICTDPNGMVALGEDVTFFCRSQDDFRGTFHLTRHADSSDIGTTVDSKNTVSKEAEFSFSRLSISQGGMYSCRSCLDNVGCSNFSDKIYLNLTDPSLTEPSIQILNPKKHPYFSVRCEGRKPHLTFALMTSRQRIHYKAADPGEKGVDFFLNSARLKDSETYTCKYQHKSSPFVWSLPSELLELPLRDPEMMNPTKETITEGSSDSVFSPYLWAGIGVSVFLIVMLLLAVILYRKKRKGYKTKEHNPAMNLSSNVEEHPDEVSYAILNHQPQITQQATNPRQTAELCLYASVVKNTSFQPHVA